MSDREPILLLDRADVRELLSWPELIAATRSALVSVAQGSTATEASQLAVPGASLHLKAGALAEPPILSVKANLRPDAGSTSGAILAFDLARQRLHAILASGDLTAMRTAAIAGVAAEVLLPRAPATVALLGAGPVAQCVDQVLTHLGLARDVRVWSRDATKAERLAAGAAGPHRACAEVAEALRGADLVVTCTPARAPLFGVADIASDAVVLGMGADTPGKQELPLELLESARLYADVRDDALRVGDSARLDGDAAASVTDIGVLLQSGERPVPDGRPLVFDSVGSSAVDAAAVALVVGRATQEGRGTWVDLDRAVR
jgi:ornithine cyclodeaminase/alanine dehydrogenase-like protein (mu-crystallin family)